MTNSIIEEENMPDRWLEPEDYRIRMRLNYIQSIQSHIPPKCPECNTHLIIDDEQIYCPACGLVTQDSTMFNNGIKFNLPHGLRLG